MELGKIHMISFHNYIHGKLNDFRYFTKGLFSCFLVSIQGGPLAGKRWGLFTGRDFVNGTYDRSTVLKFTEIIKNGDTVYDIGAHCGYYTLVASDCAGSEGSVISFEPMPLNLRYLQRHLKANKVFNVKIFDFAIGNKEGIGKFSFGKGTGRGKLDSSGKSCVKVVSLDKLWNDKIITAPNVIKMDIEGAELEALEGARALLEFSRPKLMLSVHGEKMREGCINFLKNLGYELQAIKRSTYIATWQGCSKPDQVTA